MATAKNVDRTNRTMPRVPEEGEPAFSSHEVDVAIATIGVDVYSRLLRIKANLMKLRLDAIDLIGWDAWKESVDIISTSWFVTIMQERYRNSVPSIIQPHVDWYSFSRDMESGYIEIWYGNTAYLLEVPEKQVVFDR